MPRPEALALDADLAWRRVPMPGAELGLDLVPLAADGEAFTIVGRFPAGFARLAPGGYLAAEDFVVLDGHLEIEGVRYGPGTLTHVPARYLRSRMLAPQGCTVLAWFGGPAIFREPDELAPGSAEPIRSWDLGALADGEELRTADATWRRAGGDWPAGAEGFDLAGTGWAREAARWPGGAAGLPADLVLRTPVDG